MAHSGELFVSVELSRAAMAVGMWANGEPQPGRPARLARFDVEWKDANPLMWRLLASAYAYDDAARDLLLSADGAVVGAVVADHVRVVALFSDTADALRELAPDAPADRVAALEAAVVFCERVSAAVVALPPIATGLVASVPLAPPAPAGPDAHQRAQRWVRPRASAADRALDAGPAKWVSF